MLTKVVLVCLLVASPALGSAIKGHSAASESGTKGGQRLVSPVERQSYLEGTKGAERSQQQWEQHQAVKTPPAQQQEFAATKGEIRAEEKRRDSTIQLVEQQRPVSKASEQRAEQKREEPQLEQHQWERPSKTGAPERSSEQRREEIYQREEAPLATKSAHYDAKPQVRLEESKGGRVEQSVLISSTQQRIEEQHLSAPGGTKSIKASDEQERLEQQRLEQQRLDQQQRLEQQRLEQQRLDQQRLEQQRLEQQKLEQQRLEQQRLDQQRLEQQRLEQQRIEQQQQLEQHRALEQQKLDSQKLEQQAIEQQHLDQQRLEQVQQQQREEQQAVELNRDAYEQRRYKEQTYSVQQQEQVREEDSIKGALVKGQQIEETRGFVAEPEPYAFDYSVEGSSRRESGDTKGVVRGQYTLQNPDGSARVVDYVADHNGFRATVNTNEFGTESRSPGAGVEIRSSQLPKRLDNWSVNQAPIALEVPQQAQQIVVAAAPVSEEAPRAIRGKTIEETGAPSQPLSKEHQKLEVVQYPWKPDSIQQQEPERKGELRAPKAIGGESSKGEELVGRLRGPAFESATAHRDVVHSAPAPIQHQRHHQHHAAVRQPTREAPISPVAPVHHRHHLQPPVRSHIHAYDRHHAPSSVGSLLRPRGEQSPRLSFYGSNTESVDESAASFEHPVAE